MTHTIDYKDGKLLLPGPTEEQTITVQLQNLGWDFEKNLRLQAQIPCFTAGGFPLIADALLLSDEGEALAVVLCGFPLENDDDLRIIADIYSNSAKREFGVRPAVFFLTDGKCKAANSLLGRIQEDIQPLPKPMYLEFLATHNIQEEVFFSEVLNDPDMAKAFLTDSMDTEKINDHLMEVLEHARQFGLHRYYQDTVAKDDSVKKRLLKQAILLGGLGEERYVAYCQQQIAVLRRILDRKATEIVFDGAEKNNWFTLSSDTPEGRLQQWAFAYLGWEENKNVKKNLAVPCYYKPSMQLLVDYAFLDPNGKPVLLFLRDELHLSTDKAFITAEFYARSSKAAYGIVPFVVFYSDKGAFLKMGAFSGGFEPFRESIPAMQLAVQVACVNITELLAWEELQDHVEELRSTFDEKERLQKQLQWIRASSEDTAEKLHDADFMKAEFERICSSKELQDETFWKAMMGEIDYEESRDNEFNLIRMFVTDKRIAAGILE